MGIKGERVLSQCFFPHHMRSVTQPLPCGGWQTSSQLDSLVSPANHRTAFFAPVRRVHVTKLSRQGVWFDHCCAMKPPKPHV